MASYSLSEIANSLASSTINNFIPIYIAKRKTKKIKNINLVENDINIIQLEKTDNIIDYSSIIPNMSYWERTSNTTTISNDGSTISSIAISLAIYNNFNNKSLFVIYDDNYNLIFISSLSNVIYSSTTFISATLDLPTDFNGMYNCCFIQKNQANIPISSINTIINTINIDWTDINVFTSAKNDLFPILLNNSTISYNIILNEFNVISYTSITSDDINNEYNLVLREAFKYSNNGCIVISYPTDLYLEQLLDVLSGTKSGYYIVPIDVSESSYNSLSQYILSLQDKSQFLSTLLSIKNNLWNSQILLSSGYTK